MKKILFALMCLFPLALFADGVELPKVLDSSCCLHG